MTDKFSAISLGETLDESQAVVIPCECASSIVKGQIVKANNHVDNSLPKVAVAADADAAAIGVALKSGSTGDVIPVLVSGIAKVTAGAGGVTLGAAFEPAANGCVEAGTTSGKILGRGLQTLSSGDTGLVLVK